MSFWCPSWDLYITTYLSNICVQIISRLELGTSTLYTSTETQVEPRYPHNIGLSNVLFDIRKMMCRLVFSGHTHRWCDIIHADGTREITVPSLSWRNRNDPSFVMATFHTNSSVTVQRCMLANESTMIVLYIIWGLVTMSWLLATTLTAFNHVRHKSVKPEWPYGKGVYPKFVGGIHLFVLSLEALKARTWNLLESENDLMEWRGREANVDLHLVSPVHQDQESPSSTHRQQPMFTRKILKMTKLPAE